jgi:hypothetical protein
MTAISSSEARKRWADVFTQAVGNGAPVAIERGRDERGLLIGFEELRLLLDRFPFTTEVFFEGDAVTVWLTELELLGRGPSFDEATEDLVSEVRAYVDEYLADARVYLHAPNRRAHFPWIVRAYVADTVGLLPDVLTAAPPADRAAAQER